MTQAIALARAVAPITASRCAAPTPSAPDITDPQLVALYAAAEDALILALSMLRDPTGTAADLQRTTGRVIRAATLLKRACAAQAQGGAA